MNTTADLLLTYCIALDAGNFDMLGDVLQQAETDPGLEAAILAIHRRFDTNEEFTQQLLRERKCYQEKQS